MCGTLEPCSTDTVHARPDRATIPPYRCCGEPDAHADARDATRHTPRRARGETVYAVYTVRPTPRTDVRLCRSSVALRDGRWDPHESRDQLICAVPNSFLRQLSGEAEQRARRGVTRPWDRVRASGSPPRPPRPALCGFAPPDRCAMIVRCTEMPLLAIFAGGNHGLPIARGQEPFLCLSRLGILSCGGFVQGAFPL